jgi:hypothetical protein
MKARRTLAERAVDTLSTALSAVLIMQKIRATLYRLEKE